MLDNLEDRLNKIEILFYSYKSSLKSYNEAVELCRQSPTYINKLHRLHCYQQCDYFLQALDKFFTDPTE